MRHYEPIRDIMNEMGLYETARYTMRQYETLSDVMRQHETLRDIIDAMGLYETA